MRKWSSRLVDLSFGLAAVLLAAAGCKRVEPEPQNFLKVHPWKLKSATTSPGRKVNGRLITNLFEADPQGCLANNYTLRFDNDSTCKISSNGALCDMVSGPVKWKQNGQELFLGESGFTIRALDNSKLILLQTTDTRSTDGVQTVTYIYTAEDK